VSVGGTWGFVDVGIMGMFVGVAGAAQPLYKIFGSPWLATKCPSSVVKASQTSLGWFPCPCVIHLFTEFTDTLIETYLPAAVQWHTSTLSAADTCFARSKLLKKETIRNAPLRKKAKLLNCLITCFVSYSSSHETMREMDLPGTG
jgi:hypothetical protein